jgi:hypothetical protein
VQVNTIQATAQVPFHGTVATMSGASRANDTTAEIHWGMAQPHPLEPWWPIPMARSL